eukprot:gb/GECH01011525.1/.p1 GENE.gb/GECH01011525.1/~~gb/GECH01011525.1/.p1  ORF type:complete len:116 (+),score=13.84 gb/GECH01011525.1/:1-348(+)
MTAPAADWYHGLCSCFDNPKNCCYAWCCNPCAKGQAQANFEGNDCCCNTIIYMLTDYIGVGCCWTALVRKSIREGYGIDGSLIGDCLATACCPCCVATQMLNETERRGGRGARMY